MTALDFPNNPTDGQIYNNYVYDASRNVWRILPNVLSINSRYQVQSTPPTNPIDGEIWLNSTDGVPYIWYVDEDSGQWIEVGGLSGNLPGPQGEQGPIGETGPAGEKGDTGETGVVTAEAPITYDVNTKTVGVDRSQLAGVSHNYIINGAFDVAQRGESFSVVNNEMNLDRWFSVINAAPSSGTISRRTLSPAEINAVGYGDIKHCSKLEIVTAGSITRYDWRTRLENVESLAGQTVTLSFWAKGSRAASGIFIYIQQFGTGGSAAVTNTPSLTWPTEWTRISNTFTLPSITGKTVGPNSFLEIGFRVNSPADGEVFEVTGVQLEAGSVATPFKRHAPSLQGELAACEPYYQLISGQVVFAANTAVVTCSLNFRTPMRAAPSVTLSAPMKITDASADFTQSSSNASFIASRVDTRGGQIALGNFTGLTSLRPYTTTILDSQIILSAEL
jgi:hypothetical protein